MKRFLSIFAIFWGVLFSASARDVADIVDGVAASMSEDFDFDRIAAAMVGFDNASISKADIEWIAASMGVESTKKTADLDRVMLAMAGRSEFAGVADAMSVNGTLDYISNAFSTPSNNYLTTFGPGRTGQGHSAMLPAGAVLPITGVITSRFGWRAKYNRMHKGVDIALHIGDTIRAAVSGRVTRVDTDPRGYGLFVVISHENGLETRYAHLSGTLVWQGQNVYAGDPVALGGNTGNSTGPHLHFETRVGGTAVDPTTMFDFTHPGREMQFPGYGSGYGGLMASQAGASTAGYNSTNKANGSTYVVRVGDTVQSVARANGISVLSLCKLNMLSTYEALEPGRMLKLR